MEKVELVREPREEHELSMLLSLLDLPPSTWYYHTRHSCTYEEKYRYLRKPLEQIALDHPEYGYRRTKTELSEMLGRPVNHKVIQRLHRHWDLKVLRGTKHPRPSGIRQAILQAGKLCNLVAGIEHPKPFEVLYTDFTELCYTSGKGYLIPFIDHCSKYCIGWAVGEYGDADLALVAWDSAVERLQELGIAHQGLIVHHDRGSVFTSYRWTSRLLLDDRVRVSYALGGAKDNPEMESFNSRFKTENRSLLREPGSLEELIEIVNSRMRYYNEERRHSTLGNQAPLTWLRSWFKET